MTAFSPSPQRVPDQVVHLSEGPCGGAVAVIVAPASHCRVEVVYDLDCWALLVLVQIGSDGAVMSEPLCLLWLRQQGPSKPPDLESEEVEPFCAMHNAR